jgi:hypothetical protein
MEKYRAVLISFVVSIFIFSGCTSEPTPPPIPTLPTTTLQSWRSAALQNWSKKAVGNYLGYSEGNNWSGCKSRFILTDTEIGFCQGFNLAKWEFENNMRYVITLNYPVGHKQLQTSLTSIKQKCGSGEYAGIVPPVEEYNDDVFSLMKLREATNTKDWYEGCISGFSFQIKLRELYEKTPAAKTALEVLEAAKAAYKARKAEEDANSSTSADEDQPNSSNSKEGVSTGDDSESGYWVSKCRTITELNPDYNDSDPSSIVDNLRGPSRFVTKRKCTDVWVKN